MTNDNLDCLNDDDFRKAEEFVWLMRILFTSTLCMSNDVTIRMRTFFLHEATALDPRFKGRLMSDTT